MYITSGSKVGCLTFANFPLRKLVKTLNVAALRKDANAVCSAINDYGLQQVLMAVRFVNVAFVPWIANTISNYLGDVSRSKILERRFPP
jgi:predicted lysophospholipase L1 biosynthesis ABC-type transport system permease subunit